MENLVEEKVVIKNKKHPHCGKKGIVTKVEENLCIIVKLETYVQSNLEGGYGIMVSGDDVEIVEDFSDVIPCAGEMQNVAEKECKKRYRKAIEKIAFKIQAYARDGITKIPLDDIIVEYFDNDELPEYIKYLFIAQGYRFETAYINKRSYDAIVIPFK